MLFAHCLSILCLALPWLKLTNHWLHSFLGLLALLVLLLSILNFSREYCFYISCCLNFAMHIFLSIQVSSRPYSQRSCYYRKYHDDVANYRVRIGGIIIELAINQYRKVQKRALVYFRYVIPNVAIYLFCQFTFPVY